MFLESGRNGGNGAGLFTKKTYLSTHLPGDRGAKGDISVLWDLNFDRVCARLPKEAHRDPVFV